MKALLTLVMLLGVLLLPGSLWAQCAAPVAGEVQCTTTLSNLVAVVNGQRMMTGVREVEVRDLNVTSNDVNAKFLAMTSSDNVLIQIGNNLGEGQKVDIRTTDGQRFRVQKTDSGQLRVQLRDVNLGTMTPQDLAKFFSDNGFGRVEIRGNGFRVERRGAEVVKNEVEADHSGRGREGTSASINSERARADRGRDMEHSIRGRERAELERERVEHMSRPERVERPSRPERIERTDRHGRN